LNDVRKTGKILVMYNDNPPEKKVTAFKAIAFLISSSEDEPVNKSSDNLSKYEGDPLPHPCPWGTDLYG